MKARYFEPRINLRTGEQIRSAMLVVEAAQATADSVQYDNRTFYCKNRNGDKYTTQDGKYVLYYETGSKEVDVNPA